MGLEAKPSVPTTLLRVDRKFGENGQNLELNKSTVIPPDILFDLTVQSETGNIEAVPVGSVFASKGDGGKIITPEEEHITLSSAMQPTYEIKTPFGGTIIISAT